MEQFVITKEFLTQFELKPQKDFKVSAIVLLCQNSRAFKKNFFDCDLMGKKMKDWLFDALSDFPIKTAVLKEKDNPYETIRPLIKDEDFTLVLFSDTPLVSQSVVIDIVEYVTTKNLDFCKLPRGFVVKSKSFLSGKNELSSEPNFFSKNDFFAVFDYKTLALARDVLRNKILDRHLKNQVIIKDTPSVSIDDEVKIERGVEIFRGNVLKGKTKIGKNVVLKENNIIENSVIGDDCTIFCSVVQNVNVKEKTNIGPFCHLKPKKEKI